MATKVFTAARARLEDAGRCDAAGFQPHGGGAVHQPRSAVGGAPPGIPAPCPACGEARDASLHAPRWKGVEASAGLTRASISPAGTAGPRRQGAVARGAEGGAPQRGGDERYHRRHRGAAEDAHGASSTSAGHCRIPPPGRTGPAYALSSLAPRGPLLPGRASRAAAKPLWGRGGHPSDGAACCGAGRGRDPHCGQRHAHTLRPAAAAAGGR